MLEDQLLTRVTLRDHANTLETLTRLAGAYIYEIEQTDPTNEVSKILTNTLLSHTDLQISDSDFILRAYGKSLDLQDSWEGQANARLIIAEPDGANNYLISAQSNISDRTLPCGELTLSRIPAEQITGSRIIVF